MATSVRRPFIGSPQRAVVPSVCNGTATSCSFDPQCKGENRLFLGRRSLSVGSSDRIEDGLSLSWTRVLIDATVWARASFTISAFCLGRPPGLPHHHRCPPASSPEKYPIVNPPICCYRRHWESSASSRTRCKCGHSRGRSRKLRYAASAASNTVKTDAGASRARTRSVQRRGGRRQEERMIIALYVAAAVIMAVGSLYLAWRNRDVRRFLA